MKLADNLDTRINGFDSAQKTYEPEIAEHWPPHVDKTVL